MVDMFKCDRCDQGAKHFWKYCFPVSRGYQCFCDACDSIYYNKYGEFIDGTGARYRVTKEEFICAKVIEQ
jgi:hypothetical protein